METLASKKILEIITTSGKSIYGEYDDNATFDDALSAFFDNYNDRDRDINKYSFYSEYLKKYITEEDLNKKISTYKMPNMSKLKLSYYEGDQWTYKNSILLKIEHEYININIKIHQDQKTNYESKIRVYVHCYSCIEKLKDIINEKTKLLSNYYNLYFDDKLMDPQKIICDYHIRNGDTINLIKKSDSELEKEKILNIYIRNDEGMIKCPINGYSKIFDIKIKILEEEGILISDQCLKYENKDLDNNELASRYNIKEGSELILTTLNNNIEKYQIFSKILTGKTICLDVNKNMIVYDIKYLTQIKEGIPIDKQNLIFNGRLLLDEWKISDYNIKSENMIHLIMNLRGGMYHETSGRNGGFKPLEKKLFKIISRYAELNSTSL
jgi:Ubiquitin family./Ubiquitin-2 like Rad60 SUMO-like.